MERLIYLKDEKIHPWLAMLLESYTITDKGFSTAIESETTNDCLYFCE